MSLEWTVLEMIVETKARVLPAGTIVRPKRRENSGQPLARKGPGIVTISDTPGFGSFIVARDLKLAEDLKEPEHGWNDYYMKMNAVKSVQHGYDGIVVVRNSEELIVVASVGASLAPGAYDGDLKDQIIAALQKHPGKTNDAAESIGLTKQQFYRAMARLGIDATGKGGRPVGSGKGGRDPGPEGLRDLLNKHNNDPFEVAKEIGVHARIVYSWMAKHGVSTGKKAGRPPTAALPFGPVKKSVEDRRELLRPEIEKALKDNNGKVKLAAAQLDISPHMLYYYMGKMGIETSDKAGRPAWNPNFDTKKPETGNDVRLPVKKDQEDSDEEEDDPSSPPKWRQKLFSKESTWRSLEKLI